MVDKGATDECRGNETNSTGDSAPKLTRCQVRSATHRIVHPRTHAARVGKYLANCVQNGKRKCELQAHNSVQSDSKSASANGGEHSLPGQRVRTQSTCFPIEFDRKGDASRDAGSQAKDGTHPNAVAKAEDDRIRYRPRKQPQRAVLPTEQIVSEIKAAQHVQATTANGDGRDGVVVQFCG